MGCLKEPRPEEAPPLWLRGPGKKLGKDRGYLFPPASDREPAAGSSVPATHVDQLPLRGRSPQPRACNDQHRAGDRSMDDG